MLEEGNYLPLEWFWQERMVYESLIQMKAWKIAGPFIERVSAPDWVGESAHSPFFLDLSCFFLSYLVQAYILLANTYTSLFENEWIKNQDIPTVELNWRMFLWTEGVQCYMWMMLLGL